MPQILASVKQDGEELVREYVKTGNSKLREAIVKSYAPLIKHVVKRFHITHSNTLDEDDLYQAGIFGLLKALDRFRPEAGVPFKSFVYKRIHGEVVDTLRKEGFLGRDKYEQVKQLEKAVKILTDRNGFEPSTEEICAYMDISEKQYFALLNTSQLTYMVSLNTRVSDDEGDFIYRIDTLSDEDQLSPEDRVERDNLRERLKTLIEALPQRKKMILALYFYEELTLSDISKVVHLTEARISQILNQTLVKIRAQLNQ